MKKKIATRPISGFDELDAAGIGVGYRGMVLEQASVPEAEIEPAGRTWGEAATDMGAGALKGALGVAQLGARVGDALTYRQGDENPAIRFLNEYGEAVDMQKSEKLKGEEQKAQQAIAAAGQSAKERYGDGLGGKVARFGAEFGTGAYEAVSNPTLLANSLAEQIPMMGTMKAGQKAAELLALGATKVAPGVMATSIGKRIAGNAGLGGAVATGMALQGSDIKGDTYRRMMELPLDMWRQNPEFVTLAKSIGEDAAKIEIAKRESSTAGWQSAGASLATSLLPGGTAMERALVGGKKIPLKAVPQSVAGEFTQESGEEGLGQLASNNAVAKINAKQDRMEGVGGAAGQGGAVGGVLGGSTTLARVGLQNYADKPTTPAIDPAIAAAAAQAAQQEAARKAAVSAAHTAAATPNSPISRMVAAANPLTPEEAWAKAQELDAQAALDEANGVAPVDPDTAPAAVPSGDPIEDTQKLIDASLAQAEQDKAAQRAAMGNPVVPAQQAGEAPAPTVKESLTTQPEPAATTAPQAPEQFPPAQVGDILNLQGKPFNTMAGAMMKLKRLGDGHEIVRVDGGLAIRPTAKSETNQGESVAVPAQAATETVANDQYQTDDERLASKRAAWQALKSTGAPDDVVASSVQGYQQKANAIGKPMVLWRHPTSGTLGFVPQGQKTPFAGGEMVATIHPDAPESVIAAQVSAQSKSNPLAGQPIDKDWTAFHPESGTLNVPRADMPQIKAEHRGAMVNFLKARGIDSTQEEVPTESLKPTQTEYSPEKVEKAKGYKGGDRSILVSSDGHVLDGHHQWVAKHEAGEPVKVIRLDAPIDALLSAVREFPSAETTVNSTTQEKANEKAPKTEQDSAKPEAATGAEPVNAAEPDQPAAEPAGASPSEVDLTTVEGVARAVQLKVAANRRKSREKSRKEREAKGYAPNSTPESEQADYEAEISGPPSDLQKQSAAAMLGTDPLPLIRMFVHGQYEASEDVFKAITGVKIRGLSEAAKKAALYQWAKWTPEQIAQAEGDAQARKDEAAEKQRQDDLKSAVMGTWLGLDRLKVKEKDGTESTGQEFVLKSVASGFDKAHAQKKGAATVYGLTDGTRFISLKAKPFTEFVKAAIAYGGLDKALEYVNPPKPQAPEGFVDRSIDTADSHKADPAPVEPEQQAEPAAPAAPTPPTEPEAPAAPAPTDSAPSAKPAPRPKNWDKNYGAASKIAEAIGIALRGANGKMKKVPELVAEIKAADAAASAAAQDADLSKSQPKVDTTAEPVQKPQESEQVDAAQAEWTRTRDVDRMAMMLKLGYSEEVARRTAGKSWENVGSVFKAKLAKAMAEPLTTVAPTAPTGEDALYTSTAKLTQPYTLDDFIGNVDAGYRAHFDYAGADGRTLWIERVDGGWVLKSKDDDSTTTITKGGAGIGGRWSKGEALRAAEDDAKYRYTEWKPVVPKAPDATQTPKETTSETARKAEFALKDGTRAKVVENATRGVFTVSVANAKGENFESYGTFQMDDQFGISRVAARANWAMDAVREASYQFVLQQKEQAEKKPADQKSKPRLGESAAEVEQKFKKEAQALHYLEGHGMVPVVARNPAGGETYTFAPNTGTLSVVLDGGARIRPASRNEKSTFAAELSRDQLQITANSRWGGSGSKTGSKVLAVLHSPSGNSFQKFESSSPAVQDFIDGKRDDAPTIEEVKAELSPLTKARNFLMELEAKLEGQGRVVDDRLVQMIRQQKDVIKELEAEQGKAQDLPSQEASNTIQSSPIEDSPIYPEDRDVLDAAKAKIAELDSKIERHEALLNCLK